MGMAVHILKIRKRFYEPVRNGTKTFEIRRDDRGFKVGDTLILRMLDDHGEPTPHALPFMVRYILTHDDFPDGIPEGYVVMSIGRKIGWTDEEKDEAVSKMEDAGMDPVKFMRGD